MNTFKFLFFIIIASQSTNIVAMLPQIPSAALPAAGLRDEREIEIFFGAIKNQNANTVRRLLARNPNLANTSFLGQTALEFANAHGNTEIKALIGQHARR